MKNFIIIFGLVISSVGFSQKRVLISEYTEGASQIFAQDEITYYGMDFSLFHLVNARKIGNERQVEKYLKSWTAEFESYWIQTPYDSRMSKHMKMSLDLELEVMRNRFLQPLDSTWISGTFEKLDLEEIQAHINTYEVSGKGVGYVILVEACNKPLEQVVCNYVFFDKSSKKVLGSSKIYGWARKSGMERHWRKGLESSYMNFLVYFNRLRKKNS